MKTILSLIFLIVFASSFAQKINYTVKGFDQMELFDQWISHARTPVLIPNTISSKYSFKNVSSAKKYLHTKNGISYEKLILKNSLIKMEITYAKRNLKEGELASTILTDTSFVGTKIIYRYDSLSRLQSINEYTGNYIMNRYLFEYTNFGFRTIEINGSHDTLDTNVLPTLISEFYIKDNRLNKINYINHFFGSNEKIDIFFKYDSLNRMIEIKNIRESKGQIDSIYSYFIKYFDKNAEIRFISTNLLVGKILFKDNGSIVINRASNEAVFYKNDGSIQFGKIKRFRNNVSEKSIHWTSSMNYKYDEFGNQSSLVLGNGLKYEWIYDYK